MRSRTFLIATVALVVLAAGGLGAWTAASEGATVPDNPLAAARFELTIDGHSVGVFSELTGIVSGYDPETIQLATRDGEARSKLPGTRTPPTVTLKRALTSSLELAAWHELAMTGSRSAVREVVLVAYDGTGAPIARYQLHNAWPAKLEVAGLKAGASEVLMETVTLVCDSLQRVSV